MGSEPQRGRTCYPSPLCNIGLNLFLFFLLQAALVGNCLCPCEAEQSACGSDYVKLQELQAKQAELEEQLEYKTERWVYLNELKEKIDAQ